MVFSSHLFLFYFLPLVLLLNYSLPFRWLSFTLTVLSYIFYGWANPVWVLLMLASSYIDYFCGLALVKFSGGSLNGPELPALPMGQPRSLGAKIALTMSMCSNLGILGFFKYYDFGVQNVSVLLQSLGVACPLQLLHIALPVGVSLLHVPVHELRA
jgi:alginate O-acetyltransferase complex protein AlgI